MQVRCKLKVIHGSRRSRQAATILALSFSAAVASAQTGGGPAADGGQNAAGIEEVTVTARRRAENVQDVPISMSVVSSEQLGQQGVADFRELDGFVPNMVQVGLDSNVSPKIAIRGISSDARNTGFESGISVYVDGVYQGRPSAWMTDLINVERFEVLRGPQGTLFGKNTTAGAVNITTRRPGDKFEGSGEIESGDFNLFRARGTLSGPIVAGKTAFSLSGFTTKRDGFQTNLADGRTYGNKNQQGGRAQLLFTPSEALEILISGDYLKERIRPPLNQLIAPLGGPFGVPAGSRTRDVNINEPAQVDREVSGMAADISYTLANGGVITSITADRTNNLKLRTDEDLTAAAVFPRLSTRFDDREKQLTQELRYASPSDQPLRFVAGLFYYDQKVVSDRDSLAPPGGLGFNATATVGPRLNGVINARDIAIFGQVNYEVTDRLELTAGGRYTETDKTLDFRLAGIAQFGVVTVPQTRYELSDNAFSPMVTALFKATDDVNLYLTASRGFKGGGFNADFVSNPNLAFGAEYATTYEAGMKSSLFDGKARVNVAVFRTDYTDLQLSTRSPLGGTIIVNAGESKIDGGEFELEARPWTGMTIVAGLGYTDATFSDYAPNSAFNGNRLPNAPKMTTSISADQKFELGGMGSITLRGEYTDRGNYFLREANAATDRIEGYGLTNVRITYASPNGRYEVQGWVENASDKLYVVDRGQPIGGAFGQRSVVYGNPRTYGVRLLVRF